MVKGTLTLLAVLGLAGCGGRTPGPGGQPLPDPVATAEMMDASGKRIGVATFTSADTGSRLAVSVAGLPAGEHGIHIHQVGECAPPGFTTAGPHYNPEAKQHGLLSPEGPHAGDLPNLRIEADGSADTTFQLDPTLLQPGERSIVGTRATALVIHAKADDQRTDPSGNSGDRIACGVIRPG
jgi:superoxide dismutase, Cu-Zn family